MLTQLKKDDMNRVDVGDAWIAASRAMERPVPTRAEDIDELVDDGVAGLVVLCVVLGLVFLLGVAVGHFV